MENSSEPDSPGGEVKLLFPGHFSLIHGGHTDLITQARKQFSQPRLIIGILNDKSKDSVLTIEEKLETFSHIRGVDSVRVLDQPLTEEWLDRMEIDYVITWFKDKYSFGDRLLCLDEPKLISSCDLVTRVFKNASHIDINPSPPPPRGLRSKVQELARFVKLSSLQVVYSIEDCIDSCRFYLQEYIGTWGHNAEKALRVWVNSMGTQSKQFYRVLKEVILN